MAQKSQKPSWGPGLLDVHDVHDAGYDSKCTLVKNKETPPLCIHIVSPSPKMAGMELLNCNRLSRRHCSKMSPGQHGGPYITGTLLLFCAVWQKEAGHGTGWDITSPGEGINPRV